MGCRVMAAQSWLCWFHPASASSVGSIVSRPSARRSFRQLGHPVDVLLDRYGHVRQDGRAAGSGEHEEVREPGGHQAQVSGRSGDPLLLERQAIPAGHVRPYQGAGHGVEAGGVHDGVETERFVRRLDAVLGDADDRFLAQVDEPDVRQVEGLEVAGVETRPLGTEVVATRAQRLGGLRVVHRRADLLPDHLGHDVVGGRVHALVGEDVEDAEQLALLPGRLEPLAADLLASGAGEDVGRLDGHPAARPPGGVPVGVAVLVQLLQRLGRGRAVVRRDGEVRGALEDRELARLEGDERDGLDAGRAGADDRDPLAGEVDALVRPAAGEVDRPGETSGPFDVRRLRHRQAAGGHDVVPAPHLPVAVGRDHPLFRRLVPASRGDGGRELDVRAQLVAVGHEPQVVQDLRLGGVLLRPGPLLLQLRVEAEGVVRGGDVAARPGIAVPVPRPADVVGHVEDPHRQPELA